MSSVKVEVESLDLLCRGGYGRVIGCKVGCDWSSQPGDISSR